MRRTVHRPRVLAIVAFAALLLGACTTVADGDDPTPPALELYYRLDGDEWELVEGLGFVFENEFVDEPKDLLFWARAEDSGGVKRLTLTVSGDVSCAEDTGTLLRRFTGTVDVEKVDEADASVGAGDRTESVRQIVLTHVALDHCVPSDPGNDHWVASEELSIEATAENFAGDVVTSTPFRVERSR